MDLATLYDEITSDMESRFDGSQTPEECKAYFEHVAGSWAPLCAAQIDEHTAFIQGITPTQPDEKCRAFVYLSYAHTVRFTKAATKAGARLAQIIDHLDERGVDFRAKLN